MRVQVTIATIMICFATRVSSQEFQCPEPIKQTESNIKADITGQAQALLKISSGQLKGAVETSVVNLFEKYPNADRIAIIQTFQSMTCNLVKKSSLPDQQKFSMILELATSMQHYLK
jgi:hypothetical protein